GQKIAIEVKSFIGASLLSEFHTAVGQFMNYRMALKEQDAERILYLAVPKDTYKDFFTLEFGQIAIRHYQLKLIVYDVESEVIIKWQN
ncbi:MAG: element excision factor XisH family protein, partial [bacterium]